MTGRTVFAECMSVFDELHAMEKEMEALTRSMSELDHESPEYSNVADRYQQLEHEFVARDGYTLEAQVGQVLDRSRFSSRRLEPADRRVLRWLADAAGARKTAACKSRICCCSTSRPTTWISKPAIGSKNT